MQVDGSLNILACKFSTDLPEVCVDGTGFHFRKVWMFLHQFNTEVCLIFAIITQICIDTQTGKYTRLSLL